MRRPRLPDRTDLANARHWVATKLRPRPMKVVVVVLVLLIALRLALPTIVKAVINDRLANLEGYYGHVEDVDIALWRGAYELHGMNILNTGGDMPAPLFAAEEIDIAIDWYALFAGRIDAEITLLRPVINFVVANGETQAGEDNDWRQVVDDIIPISVNRLEVHQGMVTYVDNTARPRVSVQLTELEVTAGGLSTTIEDTGEELPAYIDAYAMAMNTGHLEAHMRLDPWNERPTFDLDLALERLQATEINDLLSAYAGVDAEAGRLFCYAELSARNGAFEGYVKPMAEGLSIYRPETEDGDVIDVLGDMLVGLVIEVFENHGTDRFATRVPVSGSFESPGVDAWTAVTEVLYNAFIEAISHGVENAGGWRREPTATASR